MTTQSREIGILFGDVAGSTKLYETLGDRAALKAIDECVRLMSAAVVSHGGVVVKTIGDEVMAAIPDPSATCDAAMAMQRKIEQLPACEGVKLGIRVGFVFGLALEDDNDYFGDTVNTAARMVGLAKAGQIITTGDTLELLSPIQRSSTRDLDRLPVKGKAEEIRVIEVLWQESAEMTMMFSTRSVTPLQQHTKLQLRHYQREWIFDEHQGSVSLGREADNLVVVSDHQASRKHATIERRRDKWVLTDHSTNGTFVTIQGEQEIGLKREELILRNKGIISFGHPAATDAPEFVRFEVL